MPGLLSGSALNPSSPSGYANLSNVQYKLGPTPTTSTGYTLIANTNSQATYQSSLGNIQFSLGSMFSNIPNQPIILIGTGTSNVIVAGTQTNVSTNSGALVVQGGIGISAGLYTGKDIHVNGLTIGQGYQGINNIVITALATATQAQPNGQNSIVIGYSALAGLNSSENSIAIGRYALSSGTNLINNIAVGDSSLYSSGTIPGFFVGNITAITTGTATVITVANHNLSTGTQVIIKSVVGTTQLNGNVFQIKPLTANTFQLYPITDPNFIYPVNSTGYSTYISSGTVNTVILSASNIAMGTNAGYNFYNGQQNFFLGNNAAQNFTTGSYNFFIGYSVSNNMTNGNNNISFNGKNMVDGQDNQINFGSVFYYNGGGYLALNADTGVGLGDDSTSTVSGAFNVYGGAGISGSLYIGANLNVSSTGTITLTPGSTGTVTIVSGNTGTLDNMVIGANYAQSAKFTTVTINNTATSISTTTGALVVTGGVGIGSNLYIGGVGVNSQSVSTTTGALILANNGGVGIGGNANIGGYLTVKGNSTITNNLVVGNNVNIANNLYVTDMAFVLSTTTAVSTVTGALQVAGGVGVQGSIYSNDGNPLQNNLLYTPKVTVSTTNPPNPKIGDFWINTSNYAEYQWINDGGNTFWIQIAQL
jgi:hypothetical protein